MSETYNLAALRNPVHGVDASGHGVDDRRAVRCTATAWEVLWVSAELDRTIVLYEADRAVD